MKSKTIILPTRLLNDLEAFFNENPSARKLKIDNALYLVGLITELESNYRNQSEEEFDNYIPLDSQLLKRVISKYNIYLDLLVKHEFLDKINYSTDRKRSSSFKINDKYLKSDEWQTYELTNPILLKNFDEKGLSEHHKAKWAQVVQQRPHLIRFFDDYFRMETEKAHQTALEISGDDDGDRSFRTSFQIITEFQEMVWKASISIEGDNRLHTNITRCPKAIRQFILYDGESIVGCDIKSSQPFFLAVLITAIIKKEKSLLERVKATKILSKKVIEQLFSLDLDVDEMRRYVNEILNGDIYLSLAEHIEFKYNEEGNPYRDVYNSKGTRKREEFKPRKVVPYKNERDLVKKVFMEILYSSPKTRIPEATVFRKQYPSIHKIVTCLHDNNVKFSYLLQYIEAYILLDVVAFKFSKRYPSIPIWSIHDSLITIEHNKELLKNFMIKEIKLITGLKPKVEFEDWKEEQVNSRPQPNRNRLKKKLSY